MENGKCNGMLMNIICNGIQCNHLITNKELIHDTRKHFIKKKYSTTYQNIECTNIQSSKFTFILKLNWNNNYKKNIDSNLISNWDLISNINLIIYNPEKIPLNNILSSIEIEIGGQIFDNWQVNDMETHINTLCTLYGKQPICYNEIYTIIPLLLAPFTPDNVLMHFEYHEIKLNLRFKEYCPQNIIDTPLKIWGKKYFLDSNDLYFVYKGMHDILTYNVQYKGPTKYHAGHNIFKLNFNHPVKLLYILGIDKSKITNIKFMLNNHIFYEGGIDLLEHEKYRRNIKNEALMLFFCEDQIFDPNGKAWINFSRIDKAIIEIDIIDIPDNEFDLDIIAINSAPFRTSAGMAGLIYSK